MSVDRARTVIAEFLKQNGKQSGELTGDLALFGGGLALDSLEAAELSAVLEDEFGSDPFSSGADLPQTVGDILAFYEAAAPA